LNFTVNNLDCKTVPFRYQSGAEVKKGDRVLFHGEPGEIEFVADPLIDDPETERYVKEYGGGVMVVEPKVFGRGFLPHTEQNEDLVFVTRLSEEGSAAKS
jgi:hypothetical protein